VVTSIGRVGKRRRPAHRVSVGREVPVTEMIGVADRRAEGDARTSPIVSVVIVSWNTRELLRRCLTSLRRVCDLADVQVIVVDNASSDGSARLVRDEFPWVELIANERNVGFGSGNNIALPRARGEYVLFLNPDTEVNDGAIDALALYLDEHPEAGIVGTTLLDADGSLQLYCNRYPSAWHSLRHNPVVARLTNQRAMMCTQRARQVRSVDWMLGACLMVRSSVLQQVGAFDPRFFVYGEEIDLQYRIRQAGWDVVYVPSPGVVHLGGQSIGQIGVAGSLHQYRGRWLFVRKHYPPASVAAHLAKTLSGLVAGLMYWSAVAATRLRPQASDQLRAHWRLCAWHLRGCASPTPPTLAPAVAVEG
jgi:N-acetylglucosaminyl-diphospho-decaprenol L-rhamnosyltransferase